MQNNTVALTTLKVKRKTLAEEARIIRHQEAKWKRIAAERRAKMKDDSLSHGLFMNLKQHRNNVVSVEARASELANAFIRGVPYVTVEKIVYWQNFWNKGTTYAKFWDKVADIAARFTNAKKEDVLVKVKEWRDAHPGFQKPEGNQFYGDMWSIPAYTYDIHS